MTDLSSGATQDLVCILDGENFQPLFVAASPMRMTVSETKTATKFVVEDGTTRSDHVVVQAIEISIDLILPEESARDTYEQIRQAWRDNRLVTVQGKVGSYKSMLITDMPHDETPELGMSVALPMRLVEWRAVKPEYGSLPPSKVKSAKQSDTSKGGAKQTTGADGATTRKASVAYRLFNS